MKKTFWFFIVVVLSALIGWQLSALVIPNQPTSQNVRLDSTKFPEGGDFSLSSQTGRVDLKSYRGKVVLIYFGYTSCPDICPTALALMSQALNGLTEQELGRVQPLFISIDPKRDTVELLQQYTTFFHPRLIGLNGSATETAAVAKRYGVAYQAVASDSAMDYLVDHSSNTYLLDQKGHLYKILIHGTAPEQIITEVRELLTKN